MDSAAILDVTLRDGGIVNDFNFGERNMRSILSAVEDSGIRFIELGYLEKNTGTERGRTQYCNEKVIEKYFLMEKKPGVTYLAMMDYGKFDVDMLQNRVKRGIDAIRLAFHKRDFYSAIPLYSEIAKRGYDVYMQPMVTLHYSDEELNELADAANQTPIKGFYFVDTFGQMQQPDIERMALLFHEKLRPDIALGFHSHNNIQMAYANAIAFLKLRIDREKMLDSSIMGMGRGAGNLNTELILSHLNQYYGGRYNISPLLNVMDTVIETIREQYPWGYSVKYYLSSVNDCSPIYASHYYSKHMLPVEQLNELLGMLKGEKRVSFDRKYAEEIYRQYNGKEPYDDTEAIEELRNVFSGKKVCLIAPGKSLIDERKRIESAVCKADLTVSLNCNEFGADYEMVTRREVLFGEKDFNRKYIIPSNISRDTRENVWIVDYYRWITVDDETHDSSGFIAIKLLCELGVDEIWMAGFDGFSLDGNRNYYDAALKRPISPEQLSETNRAMAEFIRKKQERHQIRFITQSIYNKEIQ